MRQVLEKIFVKITEFDFESCFFEYPKSVQVMVRLHNNVVISQQADHNLNGL